MAEGVTVGASRGYVDGKLVDGDGDHVSSIDVSRTQLEADVEQPRERQEQPLYDDETVERVYRKLDLRIIPAFWILYFLCSAIRSNIGIAQTMNKDVGHDLITVIGLEPSDVSLTLALFYVSYIIFDFPSNLVMSRVGPRAWMARIVIATGIVGSCFAAVKAPWSAKLLRFLLGVVVAGMWPGMAFYLTFFYPPSRTGKRIGMYYTAAQISAAVVGLISAGFQLMDGVGGLEGFRWMFLLYGLVGTVVGVTLLWWLPDKPLPPGQVRQRSGLMKWLPAPPEALQGEDAVVHYHELRRVYHMKHWTLKDLGYVLLDWRLWPLLFMYFGVVGVGIGTQLYGNIIIASINPKFTGIQISLLFAPIWIMDLIAILIFTPISDRFHNRRAILFSIAVCIQIAGLLTTTFALQNDWARYGGLLMVGFGLGPTVPICMAWTSTIFQGRHGEVGVAAATALVSGLGNLGSIVTTYALYTGWPADSAPGPHRFRKSNLVMVGILCISLVSSLVNMVLLRMFGSKRSHHGQAADSDASSFEDGAAKREATERGLRGLFPWSKK
ncbi:related to putative tartrate transporter [Cephalotrichum gorgonifer]|uniref:Related to putative tartrate transporter n=1 Tax=Cephalotrichum gorgonifer TaxID=2041049 RepID=A0AAE8MS59_9PEZI|nr:related to putative tartrate transporter [Cephalotrichum gorgonifer]